MLNEKKEGERLVQRSKEEARKMLNNNRGDVNDLEKLNEPFAMAAVGANHDRVGYFKKINSEFTSLFAYTMEDLANNKDISIIMPKIFGKHHHTFMNNYYYAEDKDSDYLDADRATYGKNANGYITPLTVKVRIFSTDEDEIIFVGVFKTEPVIKNYVHLIADKKGDILDMSSSV